MVNTENIINTTSLDTLRDLMQDRFVMIIDKYMESSAELITAIDTAIIDKDAAAIANFAHPLKSSSQQIGATQLAQLAEQLENMGRNGAIEGIEPVWKKIQTAYPEVVQRLKSMVQL